MKADNKTRNSIDFVFFTIKTYIKKEQELLQRIFLFFNFSNKLVDE